jgi:F0F1-type ATP synthase membrane subunit b/b'
MGAVMSVRLGADYWRERAEEARAQASQMIDPMARRTLLAVAENYEQLAEQAERIRKMDEAPIQS